MILWKSKTEKLSNASGSSRRRVFRITSNSIGLVYQYQYASIGEWNDSHTDVTEIYLDKWRVGTDHFYYDGTHCMYHFGWIHVQLNNQSCKKCVGES